jgi:hypothetical protein
MVSVVCPLALVAGVFASFTLRPALAADLAAPFSPAAAQKFNNQVSLSLFDLTTGNFSNAGYNQYKTTDETVTLKSYGLPLEHRFDDTPVGPLLLGINLGYGTANSSVVESYAGQTALNGMPLTSNAISINTQNLTSYNLRFTVGRPITLLPDLIVTPRVGFGYGNQSIKDARITAGPQTLINEFFTTTGDFVTTDGSLTAQYVAHFGAYDLAPAASIEDIYAYSPDYKTREIFSEEYALMTTSGAAHFNNFLMRQGVALTGPLASIVGHDLRWQTFIIANESPGGGLFHWSIEAGGAVGVNLSGDKDFLRGVDLGDVFVGGSYVVGQNVSGFKVNFGFKF